MSADVAKSRIFRQGARFRQDSGFEPWRVSEWLLAITQLAAGDTIFFLQMKETPLHLLYPRIKIKPSTELPLQAYREAFVKVSLTVLASGAQEGKTIPLTVPQFFIGRDKKCHLRPASPMVSKRHCALVVRENRVFLRDFQSTNGTFVNARQITGEVELLNGDRLTVGPLEFGVSIEGSISANTSTPLPPKQMPTEGTDDESVAAMLLFLEQATPENSEASDIGADTTALELPVTSSTHADAPVPAQKGNKVLPDRQGKEDTASAAKQILHKYMRRTR